MSEPVIFIDWLGQTVLVGDYVSYPVSSGRCINIALGKVRSINLDDDGKIKSISLDRLRSEGSRWAHTGYGQKAYRDKRTGKGIDPWAGSGKHVAELAKQRNTRSGAIITYEEWSNLGIHERYGLTSINNREWEFISPVWKDYVEEYTREPKPSVITVIENLTKVDAKLIEEKIGESN